MTQDPRRQFQMDHYKERFEHLRENAKAAEQGAWNYLLTVNGGGAAAMLAFIGAVPGYRSISASYGVLALFMAGLLLVGAAHAYSNLRISRALRGWNTDMVSLLKGNLEFAAMLDRDQKRTSEDWFAWVVGFLSLGMFLGGVAMAIWVFIRVPYPA